MQKILMERLLPKEFLCMHLHVVINQSSNIKQWLIYLKRLIQLMTLLLYYVSIHPYCPVNMTRYNSIHFRLSSDSIIHKPRYVLDIDFIFLPLE